MPGSSQGALTTGDESPWLARAKALVSVNTVISPILSNDGGTLDILAINEEWGELSVRFVGSCANCPYSLLSMEQLVKPSLLAISGVTKVSHRAQMRLSELERAKLHPDSCYQGLDSGIQIVQLSRSGAASG